MSDLKLKKAFKTVDATLTDRVRGKMDKKDFENSFIKLDKEVKKVTEKLIIIEKQAQSDARSGRFSEINVGEGATSYHTDRQGSWWGSENWSGATARVSMDGSFLFDTGEMAGWVVDDTHIYKLASGTPESSPNDGVILNSEYPAFLVYEDTAKRAELGYLSAGVYGLKLYDSGGSNVLMEVSDTQSIVAGWTISQTTLANSTNIILDASNKAISINSATYEQAGIQLQYNSGTPRAYVGDGSNQYLKFSGTTLSWMGTSTSLAEDGTFTATNAVISGAISGATLDIGGADATSFHVDIDGNMWLGNAAYASGPFRVSSAGALYAISGTFADSWTLADGYFYVLASGTPTVSPSDGVVMAGDTPSLIVYENTEKRVELGYLSSGVYGIKTYAADGTTPIFEVSDTYQKIAGFYFSDSLLATSATSNDANVLIDAGNSLFRLGPTSGDYMTLNGASLTMESSTYSAGVAGFHIDPDFAEFGNVAVRGELISTVFSYNQKTAFAGSLVVSKSAGTLKSDVTTVTSPTTFNVDIEDPSSGHTQVFAASDILLLKSGTSENWVTVSSVSDQTTFYRYVCTLSSGSGTTFYAGLAVIDYGQSGDGYLEMTADGSNAPWYSVRDHAGSPWTTVTERVRIGNLNGFLDYVADGYGFGVGTTTSFLTWDASNGLRISVSGADAITVLSGGNILLQDAGDIDFTTVAAPTTAPTLAQVAGGSLTDTETYVYTVTYVTAQGETDAGISSQIVMTAGNRTVNLTDIPISSTSSVTSRKIYRGNLDPSGPDASQDEHFIAEIADNTTTTFTDDGVNAGENTEMWCQFRENTTAGRIIATIAGETKDYLLLTQKSLGIGYNVLASNVDGAYNTALGARCLEDLVGGWSDTAGGYNALGSVVQGSDNTAFGESAGASVVDSDNNCFFGALAGEDYDGNQSIYIGSSCGLNVPDGDGNIWIGYSCGSSIITTTANTLRIENSNAALPLIYGEFDNDLVYIHGDLYVRNGETFVVNSAGNDKSLTISHNDTNAYLNVSSGILYTNADFEAKSLEASSTSGSLFITAASDGGDFNIYHAESGAKTLAFYGSGGNTLHLDLLDGNLTVGAGTIIGGATLPLRSGHDGSTASSLVHQQFEDSQGDVLVEFGSTTGFGSIIRSKGANTLGGAVAAYDSANTSFVFSYHDGSNAYLQTNSGYLVAKSGENGASAFSHLLIEDSQGDDLFLFSTPSGYNQFSARGANSKDGAVVAYDNTDTDYLMLTHDGTQSRLINNAGSLYLTITGVSLAPSADNSKDCGNASFRWDDVYATNGTIQTSDARFKTDIHDSDLGLDFVNGLRPVSFRRMDAKVIERDEKGKSEKKKGRVHYGFLAQELEALLDKKDFAGLTYDKKADIYGIRYDEIIAPLVSAVQELSKKLEILSDRK